jgi:hypothetical protein
MVSSHKELCESKNILSKHPFFRAGSITSRKNSAIFDMKSGVLMPENKAHQVKI